MIENNQILEFTKLDALLECTFLFPYPIPTRQTVSSIPHKTSNQSAAGRDRRIFNQTNNYAYAHIHKQKCVSISTLTQNIDNVIVCAYRSDSRVFPLLQTKTFCGELIFVGAPACHIP